MRQGDVLIIRCKDIPDTSVQVEPENGRLIVARGEATGHHHSFPWARGAVLFRDDGGSGSQFVKVTAPVALEHQEHSALTCDRGLHEVRIQRTFVAGLARQVTD